MTESTTKQGWQPMALIVLVIAFGLIGCARNTNSFNAGGTGMYLYTPVGSIVLGNFETHLATSELSGEEELVITDTKYFEGAGTIGAEAANDAKSLLNTQRSYSMSVTPVGVVSESAVEQMEREQ
jgi:hypothetical protein